MYHHPKPFYRPHRKRWYVQLDGKHVNLGPDEAEAWEKYHAIMAEREETPQPFAGQPKPPVDGGTFVVSVLDRFLEWLSKRVEEGTKAKRTYDWYFRYLQAFTTFETTEYKVNELTLDRLKPIHVYEWVDAQPGWKTGKRGAMTSVQRALSWWAKATGGTSPLAGLEKPQQGRREQLVSPEQYRELLDLVKDQEFRDLAELSWETGARPHELFTVEASYVDLAAARWIFPVKESKGKKIQRVVYLTDHALEITRRLVEQHPTGKLLQTSEGSPWCVSSVKCRFQRLRLALGRKRLQSVPELVPPKVKRLTKTERQDPLRWSEHRNHVLARRQEVNRLAWLKGDRYSLYSIRHSFCTFALSAGRLDAVTVAMLMGHRDTTMISRHYSHLAQRPEYMRDAARKAKGA